MRSKVKLVIHVTVKERTTSYFEDTKQYISRFYSIYYIKNYEQKLEVTSGYSIGNEVFLKMEAVW